MSDEAPKHSGSKYLRVVKGKPVDDPLGAVVADVYDVLVAFNVTCPAVAHAIKKLLCAGLREKGSRLKDLTEAGDAISRAVALETQKGT